MNKGKIGNLERLRRRMERNIGDEIYKKKKGEKD